MKRKGFGIITAIIIMMSIATLMSLMIGLSTSSVTSTSKLFLKEQAELLLKSSMEYTLLAISGHDNSNSCVETIKINYPNNTNPTHIVDIDIRYLTTFDRALCTHENITNIKTPQSDFTAIIDITVTVPITTGISETIRLHRRTIQKP